MGKKNSRTGAYLADAREAKAAKAASSECDGDDPSDANHEESPKAKYGPPPLPPRPSCMQWAEGGHVWHLACSCIRADPPPRVAPPPPKPASVREYVRHFENSCRCKRLLAAQHDFHSEISALQRLIEEPVAVTRVLDGFPAEACTLQERATPLTTVLVTTTPVTVTLCARAALALYSPISDECALRCLGTSACSSQSSTASSTGSSGIGARQINTPATIAATRWRVCVRSSLWL